MEQKSMHNDIKFELFENGLNFVVSALKHLDEPIQATDLKYAILHLSSGIELILKERLKREHWTLLFSKVEKASLKDYKNGKFMSATFDDCINRLIRICEVDIKPQEKIILNSLRDKRNRFEHFGIVDSSEALKAIVAEAINFLIDFVNNELEDEIDEDEMTVIREEALKFKGFVETRLKIIKNDLLQISPIVTCPRCLQNAGNISDGFHCLFCGYKNSDPDLIANEYVSEVLQENQYVIMTQGGEWPIYSCPNCDSETLVRTEEGYICFNCAEAWEFDVIGLCIRCGTNLIYISEDRPSFCSTCLEDIRRQ